MFSIKPRRALALALGLEAALAGAAGASGQATLPRQISLESDCNGCLVGTRIVLTADGAIQWQQLGKARLGTTDETRQGRVTPEDFAAVAALWQARGLPRMGEEFTDPTTADGPWQLLRIEHADGTSQQLFRRGEAGPPALAEVIEAITQTAHKAGL